MSWQIALTVASTVMSASQSISQGKSQKAMYDLQAKQTQADSARKALQYEERANETLRKLNTNNAAIVARGYAGGVSGLEGSSKLMQTVNTMYAGKDYSTDLSNAANAMLSGNAQADIYGTSGDIAMRGGILDAATKLASGAYSVSKVYKTTDTTTTKPKPEVPA
jgi:transcription-repair coupling factor (superfamily II helicase)